MEKGHSQQNSSALARGQGHTSITTDRDTDRQQTVPHPQVAHITSVGASLTSKDKDVLST